MLRSAARAVCSAMAVVLAATIAGTAAGLALAAEPPTVAPSPARTLAHTRIGCGVDQFDEIEQTTTAKFTDLSATALRCVLTGVGAPEHLAPRMDRLSSGDYSDTWSTGTVRWSRNDKR